MRTMSDYRCPPMIDKNGETTPDSAKLGWLQEAVKEGTNFIKNQRAYGDISKALDIIAGEQGNRPSRLSTAHHNRIKRQVREVVAVEANIRWFPSYRSEDNSLKKHENILNKATLGWWYETAADRKLREALQYACVTGTGYVSPAWEKDGYVFGRGDIGLDVYGPKDVLPIQMPGKNFQRAYAVILRTEIPLAIAHAMFPEYADQIKARRDRPSLWKQGKKKVSKYLSPVFQHLFRDRDDVEPSGPVVDLDEAYILDLGVNMTGSTIPMGEPGTNWAYDVPSLGMEIPAGRDLKGNPLSRKATAEDCRLYPNRRRMMAINEAIMVEDAASPWWHGKVPLIQFTIDDWPWDFLGFGMPRDVEGLQNSANRLIRGIDDAANVRLRPALQYDSSVISPAAMARLDVRQPGQYIDANLSMGEGIKAVLPPEYMNLPPYIPQFIKELHELMDYSTATRDISAVARAKQIPSSDSLDKLLEASGPIVTDISRGIESSIITLGNMVGSLIWQFYTADRRMATQGEDGVTEEDFEFKVGDLLPAHMPGEDPEKPSAYSTIDRAKHFQHKFAFRTTPNSMHQITQLSRKLMLIQLQKAGLPIDWWTLAEAFDIPNFGPHPKGASNVMERWMAQQRMQVEFAKEMGAAMPQQGRQKGRPPTGGKQPHVQSKDGGTRSTISQS